VRARFGISASSFHRFRCRPPDVRVARLGAARAAPLRWGGGALVSPPLLTCSFVAAMGAGKSKKQAMKEVILMGLDGSGKTTTLKYAMHGDSADSEVSRTWPEACRGKWLSAAYERACISPSQ
jgi:hypothetical protein